MPADSQPTPATGTPAIIAPVSRLLAVADVARAVAFYRDVLGFSEHQPSSSGVAAEVRSGPARIEFLAADRAPDSTFHSRPRGAAVLFFPTDDVARMRAAIIARGGKPGALAKVNWIKQQVFQIGDPDGHSLWFAQSFAEPEQPRPRPNLRLIMPALPLSDVAAGIAWYRDVLGFTVNYQQDDLGVMDRDEVRVLLLARTEKHRGIGSAWVYVEDADGLHAEFCARGVPVSGVPVSQPWGLREFTVYDPEGNEITFAQTFE
jgi:catechol 2,3-dioxygenase-like lactoylglutathione lyase family enzyme